MAGEPVLKVFEQEIGQLKKQVEGVRKRVKSLIPSPSSADILNRYIGQKAIFVLRGGREISGTFREHDRYNCLVDTESGTQILLKHAIDSIKPVE
ncbi:MAG: hypothetical protein ACLF0G_06425 [Candidatus Brocadiia bacterium]